MHACPPLCPAWQEHVKDFFANLHGHQSKTLALFALGAIRAKSIVIPEVAEALAGDTSATVSSTERRLERFLSNFRIDPIACWEEVLMQVMPYFRRSPIRLILDVTPYEEHGQVMYLGILTQSRVLPLAWKVMPGQHKWDQGLWVCVEELCARVAPHVGSTSCTLIGDSAFGCAVMVRLCQQYGWHYLFRICATHTCQHRSVHGYLGPSRAVSSFVSAPGKRFAGQVRLWQEESIETGLSAYWKPGEEEALLVISDLPPGQQRLNDYRLRWRVEATFQDLKSRGWDWESCHVRRLDRVDRMLLVLFLALWWLAHLAASCIHNGRRSRYDRSDRRDKGIFRLGRLYLLDIERHARCAADLRNCFPFHRTPTGWRFALRF